ncbi:MAG: ATP-binding protein [Pararhizobium sp.]
MSDTAATADDRLPDFLTGGGEMAALMRAKDWSRTVLGPVADWPQSLRTSVSTCLNCAFPILVWWGPDLVMLYNDEYRPILGTSKHPRALGEAGRAVWPEIWEVIGPMLAQAMGGEAARARDLLLVMDRNGYPEETYFSFSYSPIHDESGGVGGVFCPVIETTEKVLGERRLTTLSELSAAAAARAKTVEEVRRLCMAALEANRADVPFAVLYDLEGARPRIVGRFGVDVGAAAPDLWPLEAVLRGQAVPVEDLSAFGRIEALSGEAVRGAFLLPIPRRDQGQVTAALLVGLNPRRAFDAGYRLFLERAAGAIATASANARAFEIERNRAETLAELDRVKTAFFSNVSHEFRTPLTLMLGPLEEALADADSLQPQERERVEVVHRNGLRLLKLVNSLLDFSRIEAGRVQARLEPTDLAALTADLASHFRAACEAAGLALVVDCPPLPRPVHVDRDMWEKIVLNLLSNAFKFTFDGRILVRLRQVGDRVELTVTDTGVGIPENELPNLFERFHRVEGQKSRSHEGSGIGLALTKELVELHGGTVRVTSIEGGGCSFAVSIPADATDLPLEPAAASPDSASARVAAYVEEALRWLPDNATTPPAQDRASGPARATEGARVLVADDNADMRTYLCRLLRPHWQVEAVADGAAALEAIRKSPPDILLADGMMPHLDGFALLAALRVDARLKNLPVIMLSARAGESSRIEGLAAGADDYLVKPFSAEELVARVDNTLAMTRMRRQVDEALRRSEELKSRILESSQDCIKVLDLDGRFVSISAACRLHLEIEDDARVVGVSWLDLWLDEHRDAAQSALDAALAGGIGRFVGFCRTVRGTPKWWDVVVTPIADGEGRPESFLVVARDTTERKRGEEQQALLLRELNHRVKNNLATVQSIINFTLRTSESMTAFRDGVSQRVNALARSHTLLTDSQWTGAPLMSILRSELETHDDGGRLRLDGPDVYLPANIAVPFAMAVHELTTNSIKHGSLSAETGRLDVTWSTRPGDDGAVLHLEWIESGGPPVSPPKRKGFGSILLERLLGQQLGGEVTLDYALEGLRMRMDVRLTDGTVGTSSAPASSSSSG